MFFIDPVYIILMLPCMLLAIVAQQWVKGSFKKYSRVRASSGLTGAEAALAMLRSAGLAGEVSIERVSGYLSDHYDPRKKVLRLSPEVYSGQSLASVGVACHEAGHAIQHARNYAPLILRNAIVPTAGIGSNLGIGLVFLGLILQFFSHAFANFGFQIAVLGLLLFATVVVFQLINLPVEFNASSRAKRQLSELGIINGPREAAGVSTMLNAAAMTYVAATITAIVTLLYYAMLVFGGRRN